MDVTNMEYTCFNRTYVGKNHNQGDWFCTVKFNYFSGIGKLGVQSKLSDHLSLELNVMAIRSLTNIVDESQGAIGSIVPFLVDWTLELGISFEQIIYVEKDRIRIRLCNYDGLANLFARIEEDGVWIK
ncbi:MAG: hypothetical protein IPN86_24765 [Saprospiraceae bacterium]|nr:hypothetical protein [Saprospiraceae bacterium]